MYLPLLGNPAQNSTFRRTKMQSTNVPLARAGSFVPGEAEKRAQKYLNAFQWEPVVYEDIVVYVRRAV